MLLPENIRIGKVSRIFSDGYVYLDEIYPCAHRRYVTNIAMVPGYKGKYAKDLGIKIGTRALFRVDEHNRVQEIIFDAKPRKFWNFWPFNF